MKSLIQLPTYTSCCCAVIAKNNNIRNIHHYVNMSSIDLLVLDPAIRDWVVLPMVIILIFVGMGRHYVQHLIKSSDQVEPETVRYKQTAMRAQKLRVNGNVLHEDAYNMRKVYLCRKKVGLLKEKVPGMPNPMSNPSAMMDMMKGNMTFMLPNMVMMGFVSYFFAGFVLAKVLSKFL